LTKVAFVFPGQGSQSLGMLAELYVQYPIVKTIFDSVSEHLNYDVWSLTQEGPLEVLNQTAHTQVAMLTADVAVFRVLDLHVSLPKNVLMAGHSLGEYSALVCADALSLNDAAYLVQQRGQLMQNTVPVGQGAMAAIVGLTDEQVKNICEQITSNNQDNQQVTPANFNAIGQVVIAGHTDAVKQAVALANQQGARLAVQIPVSVPCHCPLLASASEIFMKNLEATHFEIPKRTVISSVDLQQYDEIDEMRKKLAAQLYLPVRWVETIQTLQSRAVTHFFECGPAKVLSGLIKRIDKSLHVMSVNDPSSVEDALQLLHSFKEQEIV